MKHKVPTLIFSRAVASNLETAEAREWLVTNGIGGYASGTLAGTLTRRYHGVLIAALQPPVGRTLIVANVEETITYDNITYELGANRWQNGDVTPRGFTLIERFTLEGSIPCWTYACADALIEKRIFMEAGANTTYLAYTVVRARGELTIAVRAFAADRDMHASTHVGDEAAMEVTNADGALRITSFDGTRATWLSADNGIVLPAHDWYRNYDLPRERERGLDDRDDHLFAGTFEAQRCAGETLVVRAGARPDPSFDGVAALQRARTLDTETLDMWRQAEPVLSLSAPPALERLVLAARQFVVERTILNVPDGRSVIAGYHWFGDWGRDTMIALDGLTLVTGQAATARAILLAFAQFVDGGMLPNYFPDSGAPAEYNTVDAALWYVVAAKRYLARTSDDATIRAILPALRAIADGYAAGTRYGIGRDDYDGLLHAGQAGVQLTWMDAKVGDWVVTPRIGKPVEINALWIDALETVADLCARFGSGASPYVTMAAKARAAFERFWDAENDCCFDVIDSPAGDDRSLRPNQLYAVSLGGNLLSAERERAIVDICAAQLYTPLGMRTLGPRDPAYHGRYGGSPYDRDGAYHQGTAWPFLLGTFALAQYKVYRDREAALALLRPLLDEAAEHGCGSLPEIADGDAPFTPRGCIAQAWSVAETLRAWHTISRE